MRIVPFYPLRRSTMREIVSLKLHRVGDRVAQAHRVTFRFDDRVTERVTVNDLTLFRDQVHRRREISGIDPRS